LEWMLYFVGYHFPSPENRIKFSLQADQIL